MILRMLKFDNEPIAHIAPQDTLICFINLVSWNHFNCRGNAMLGSKIKHLLCFPNSYNKGTGNTATSHD
ncbi:hypothetical protein PM3016_6237 [Paenibacillus mucilaginosus 3016]|uniref:Uncharacterized protein n=1 Tax=Paenibacillus mucilaginosus 3016 TaxID=1116391 RepID=H6NBC7_9BACL|nr:hypothetical protein PM3016_6237 [Paenibacillus mucilaginosus 3016]